MVNEDLDLRQLRYFLKVAELQNISAAARELNMTQPALSRQIRALEDQLDWTLLERGKKSVCLTHAGEVMQIEARKIMASTRAALKRAGDEIEGAEMKVGFAPSLSSGLIDRVMKHFTEEFPRVRVSWFDYTTREMIDGVHSGELDLMLNAETEEPGVEWQRLREKEFYLMLEHNHPLTKKRWIKPADLDGERLLLFNRHDYPGYWEQVIRYFETHAVNAKVAGEFDGISSLRMGVEAGLGCAFVAEGTSSSDKVVFKPFRPKPKPVCVSIGYRKDRALREWESGFITELRAISPRS